MPSRDQRIGLVLGGGGVVGLAYHAAALAALENDLRWDPRRAEVVVGTSAGSLVGALLRAGVPAMDLASIAVGGDVHATPAVVTEALTQPRELPPVALGSLRHVRPPSFGVLSGWLRRPWRFDPVMALVSVLPDGQIDLRAQLAVIADAFGDGWPTDDLWICVVDQHDLRRRVFGRGVTVPLVAAVAASCAVPGYFAPVEVDGRTYVDGGVRSPTNADVLARRDLDAVIVVSPMSGTDVGLVGFESVVRRHAQRKLAGERARLEAAGLPTIVIEPSSAVLPVLGIDLMSDERVDEITHAAFLDTGRQLADPAVRELLGVRYGAVA